MKSENSIPIFKKKELTLEYLSELYEDESFKRIKFLWTAMNDFKVNLELSQIMALMEYREKSVHHANELISILTGEEFIDYLTRNIHNFRESYVPETKAEKLIFNILRNVCSEIFWIDDILDMEEYDLNGDNNGE